VRVGKDLLVRAIDGLLSLVACRILAAPHKPRAAASILAELWLRPLPEGSYHIASGLPRDR